VQIHSPKIKDRTVIRKSDLEDRENFLKYLEKVPEIDRAYNFKKTLSPPLELEEVKNQLSSKYTLSIFGFFMLCGFIMVGGSYLKIFGVIFIFFSVFGALFTIFGKKKERQIIKDNKVVICDGFLREYDRTPSKSWILKTKSPYSSFLRLNLVYYTGGTNDGVRVDLVFRKNELKDFNLFYYGGSGAFRQPQNITSYSEALLMARSVSKELSIPLIMENEHTEHSGYRKLRNAN
jgi:hypothetical protein